MDINKEANKLFQDFAKRTNEVSANEVDTYDLYHAECMELILQSYSRICREQREACADCIHSDVYRNGVLNTPLVTK